MISQYRAGLVIVCAAFAGVVGLAPVGAKAAQAGDIMFAPHRAVYDLKLKNSRGRRALEGARGRIVYDFSGNACEGYALQFRQVTELDSGEGKMVVSDLRSTTWEDATAASFRYNFQNFMDRKMVDAVDGRAQREGDTVEAMLSKPRQKQVELGKVTFPTDHMRKVIQAARAGQKLLELDVYDGSENGEKIYSTLTVIGQKIMPGERKPDDATAGNDELAHLPRWPVTISYFDKAKSNAGGEQTPVYAIAFELYENGVSRALTLDYGDFAISGEMTSLELGPSKPCK